jgi:hypothetical protein
MNRLLIALGCTLLLLITGCFYLAERPTVARIVSLNFPTPKGQTDVSLSVKDPEGQEALKLIDAVLVSDGFAVT